MPQVFFLRHLFWHPVFDAVFCTDMGLDIMVLDTMGFYIMCLNIMVLDILGFYTSWVFTS